jgi:hypothetical protein
MKSWYFYVLNVRVRNFDMYVGIDSILLEFSKCSPLKLGVYVNMQELANPSSFLFIVFIVKFQNSK